MPSAPVRDPRRTSTPSLSADPAAASGRTPGGILSNILGRGLSSETMGLGRAVMSLPRTLLSAGALGLLVLAGPNAASAHPVDDNLARQIGDYYGFSRGAIHDAGRIEKNVDRWMHGDLAFDDIVPYQVSSNGARIPGRDTEVSAMLLLMGIAASRDLSPGDRAAILALYADRVAEHGGYHFHY